MQKLFTITKTGYTAGVYGNTGEYFTLIYIDQDGAHCENFSGQYGAEHRVAEVLKGAGYTEFYTYSNYGKLKRDDIAKGRTYSEYTMIEELKSKLGVE